MLSSLAGVKQKFLLEYVTLCRTHRSYIVGVALFAWNTSYLSATFLSHSFGIENADPATRTGSTPYLIHGGYIEQCSKHTSMKRTRIGKLSYIKLARV